MENPAATRFAGRVALVIGGATGIGAATAHRLAAEGARVVIGDVSDAGAQAVASAIEQQGGTARGLSCDVSDEQSVKALVAAAVDLFGRVDAAHINAADTSLALADLDAVTTGLDNFDRTLEVNLRGHLLCARHLIPVMVDNGGGSLVFTSSRAGLTSDVTRVGYGVSKAGIHALMRHVALTWGKQGIRANVIAPGTILTDALRKLGQEFLDDRTRAVQTPRLGVPEDIAAAVAFLLSDDAAFVHGQVISVDGGVTMR